MLRHDRICIQDTSSYADIPLLGLVMGVIGCIQDKNPLRSDWPLQLLILAFYSLSIGLLEEVTARGILNDGPLYQFRSNKRSLLSSQSSM